MFADLKFALRQFAKAPGFTAVVVLSLALGIGANATVLCWLENLVLRPLPGVADQGQLVVLVSNQGGGCASLPDLRDFGQHHEIFAGTEASMPTAACLTVDNQPEWIQAQIVSANFFELLGVKPVLGRTFLPDEDQKPGGNPVLVIGENLWRRRFGGDPSILGRVVDLNRHSFTIVGVVPASFHGSMSPMTFDVWSPSSMIWEVRNQGTYFLTARDARGWHNLARLQPGVSIKQAQAAVALLDTQFTQAYPKTSTGTHHRVVPLSQCPWSAGPIMGPTLKLLLAVSLGVLLIVAANVANLLLARAVSRRKEIAIRLAAGAGRGRLIRQLLTESLALALLGGVGGVLLAAWMVGLLRVFVPAVDLVPNVVLDYSLDVPTLGYTLALTLVIGVVFGLAPAFQASRLQLYETLKEGGRTTAGGGASHGLRRALVVTEIALALVLLISAGLCLQGLRKARQIQIGLNPDHVLLADLRIGMNGYTEDSGLAFYRQLRQRLAAAPGVEEAALANWFPLGLAGCKGSDVYVDGYQRPPGENTTYEFAILSPRYFAVMRIPLLAGRDFTDEDNERAPKVAIVNQAFADRFWPGHDPIGRRFRSGGQWRTVVGLTATGKYNHLNEGAWPFFYLPYQQGVPDLDLNICVRTSGDPLALAGTVRRTVHDLDPGVDVLEMHTMAAHTGTVLFAESIASNLLTLLGLTGLLLAAMGVYAVMAYAVSQRTQEFGVRLALGASQTDMYRLILGEGLSLAAVGGAIGLALALAVTRLLTGFLYGVSPFDPLTFIGVPLLLALVALLACWLPARKTTKVDPIIALRAE
jgi:predicted permease